MSAKGIAVGAFADNGTISLNIAGFSGTRWGLLCELDFDSGSLTLEGGDTNGTERVRVYDYPQAAAPGVFVVIPAITAVGLYMFEAMCEQLDFVLAGSTTPTLSLTLFPQARGT